MAFPIPVPPPVTMADLPANSPGRNTLETTPAEAMIDRTKGSHDLRSCD